MNKSFLLTLSACFLSPIFATFPYVGKCPDHPVEENFDIIRFLGSWYEIERTTNLLELGTKCITVTYKESGFDDGTIEVTHEGKGSILGLKRNIRLVAIPDATKPGKMQIRLNDLNIKSYYYILKTDYENYAVVWGCQHVPLTLKNMHQENLMILSRKRTMSDDLKAELHKVLEGMNVMSRKRLKAVSHTGC